MRGTALTAVYAATKAWNLILAESLWAELRDTGVDVLAVMPGPTRTPGFMSSAPQAGVATGNIMEPADVAHEALDALGTTPSIVAGQANRDAEAFMASLDRAEAIKAMGDVMRSTFPPDREPDPTV
jgi:short-subunit dehydrogenase